MLRHGLFKLFICSLLAVWPVFLHKTPNAYSEEAVPREYLLKTSIILKFFEFIQWPEEKMIHNSEPQFVLCVVGSNPFGSLFDLAQKEGVFRNKLIVKIFSSGSHLDSCHMVYIGKSEDNNLEEMLHRTKGMPILFIGDTPGFSRRGVGINFVILNNKIRFKINRSAVEDRNIKISSELLNLAILVDE
ncbi:conserved hypothetical protein [Nitrospina gracilis 3/211]|uniref:Transmembrane protein n=1 Tax=Nitrospina gracilis (strain 3/211) TaxID=1266370 RepID=M1Z966_NITG3|nr:YfiR family protein [Nitrospina sp. Nb-3]CCQ89657.1 conserved hypothetical protein [Nitrospina gracilis 3/211]